MKDKNKVFTEGVKTIYKLLLTIFLVIGSFSCFLFYLLFDPNLSALNITESKNDYITSKDENSEWDKIENGIHLRTGLAEAEGLMEVVNNCTNCHSAKLVTQNRMTRERWVETIDWMQETQNLYNPKLIFL